MMMMRRLARIDKFLSPRRRSNLIIHHFNSSSSSPKSRTRLYEALKLQTFTREEFSQVFDAMDADKNGYLDMNEFTNFLGPELSKELISELCKHSSFDGGLMTINKESFVKGLDTMARKIDSRVWSIAFSMLLTGSAVGVVVPILPLFVSSTLNGTSTHFGLVIGAFALTKMLGNVPSAILCDGVGRKPVLTCGMGLISLGTLSIIFSDSLTSLLIARLVTGAGVAAFTTGSTLYLADVSTPLNRATSMAPILAAFSAGTALGPAVGGLLAAYFDVKTCFAITGCCFTGVTFYIHYALTETVPERLMRQQRHMGQAALEAIKSWKPILKNDQLRAVFLVNGGYWIAISGAQTTLLPLMLSKDGLSPGEIGLVFAALSTVSVIGSQPAGWIADKYGRFPCIIGACGLVTLGIGLFPFGFYPALGLWALGGTLLGVSPTAYVTDISPNHQRSQSLAVLRTVGDIGLLIGSGASGLLADNYGFKVAMECNAGLIGATTAWFLWKSRISPPPSRTS